MAKTINLLVVARFPILVGSSTTGVIHSRSHLCITSQALSRSISLVVNLERFTRFDSDFKMLDRKRFSFPSGKFHSCPCKVLDLDGVGQLEATGEGIPKSRQCLTCLPLIILPLRLSISFSDTRVSVFTLFKKVFHIFFLRVSAEIAEFDRKAYSALECHVKCCHPIGREEHDALEVLQVTEKD